MTTWSVVTDTQIEQRLLAFAYTTDAKLTAPALAYFAPCSIADANRVLDALAAKETLRLEVEDDGTCVYHMPGRQKLGQPEPVLKPAIVRPAPERRMTSLSPLIAALLTVFIPGAGHVYAGRILSAIGWFMLVGIGYILIVPGLLLHFAAALSAARAARYNEATRLLTAGTTSVA